MNISQRVSRISCGNGGVVRWICDNGCPVSPAGMVGSCGGSATTGGRLDYLQFCVNTTRKPLSGSGRASRTALTDGGTLQMLSDLMLPDYAISGTAWRWDNDSDLHKTLDRTPIHKKCGPMRGRDFVDARTGRFWHADGQFDSMDDQEHV